MISTGTRRFDFAARTSRLQRNAIRELLKATQTPGIISFAGGLPAPELFPAEELRDACDRVLRTRSRDALQYAVSEGLPEVRDWVARRMSRTFGCDVAPQDVLIANGSQQALDLLAKIFIDPGDVVFIEAPSYVGALQAFNAYEPIYAAIDCDEDGMVPAELEKSIDQASGKPKLLYLNPNFANPSGRTISLQRRREILDVAVRHGIVVVEDDPYAELRFGGDAIAPMLALDGTASVVYCGTASKTVAPGLRVAWVVSKNETIIERFAQAKQGADLQSGSLAQFVFFEYAKDDERLDSQIDRIRRVYASRCAAMSEALSTSMPAVAFDIPCGGMFLWATLDGIDTTDLFEFAKREGVVYVPGMFFFPHLERRWDLRLNFSFSAEEEIREGVSRLARAVDALAYA